MKRLNFTDLDLQWTFGEDLDKVWYALVDLMRRLNCIRRWTDVEVHDDVENSKQALNAMIVWFLIKEHNLSHPNDKLDLRIAVFCVIYRMFEKDMFGDFLREDINLMNERNGGLKRESLIGLWKDIALRASPSFATCILQSKSTHESHFYDAATALGTLIELREIKGRMPKSIYYEKLNRQKNRLKQFEDIPFVKKILEDSDGGMMKCFRKFAALKNRIRWQGLPKLLVHSVLSHSMYVAILGFANNLRDGEEPLKLSAEAFFIGLFHDIGEIDTADMKSTSKDVIKGMRKSTGELEIKRIRERIYPLLPPELIEPFKEVVFEELEEKKMKFFKQNDSLSLLIEALSEIGGGNKNKEYKQVCVRVLDKFSVSKLYEKLEKMVFEAISEEETDMIRQEMKVIQMMKEKLDEYIREEDTIYQLAEDLVKED